MTIDNISLAQYIVGKLRKAVASGDIVDYNAANRVSAYRNFIYPDAPKIEKILKNKNNFPRVSVETLSHSSINEVGMSCTNYEELATLKISIWTFLSFGFVGRKTTLLLESSFFIIPAKFTKNIIRQIIKIKTVAICVNNSQLNSFYFNLLRYQNFSILIIIKITPVEKFLWPRIFLYNEFCNGLFIH